MKNIYKQALESNIIFTVERGAVSLQSLFSLPLQAREGRVSLDGMYSDLQAEKAAMSNNSYLGNANNSKLAEINLKLEILKDIMDDKLAAAKAADQNAAKQKELESLLAEKASRLAEAPKKLSDEDLDSRLKDLGYQG